MPATPPIPHAADRSATLRGKCSAERPRVVYRELAVEAGYSVGYVKQVMSDAVDYPDAALANLEAAFARIVRRRELERGAAAGDRAAMDGLDAAEAARLASAD